MVSNNSIQVEKMNSIGQDDRGSTFDFSVKGRENYIYIKRKAGTTSGNTYHKGANNATSPKTFVILSGELKFCFRHVQEKIPHSIIIREPCKIYVQPFVIHSVEALTDIHLLECNSINDIKSDRYFANVLPEDMTS